MVCCSVGCAVAGEVWSFGLGVFFSVSVCTVHNCVYIYISIIYVYVYALDVFEPNLGAAAVLGQSMRPISSGVASGSSLAIALKLLGFLDRQDPLSSCAALGLDLAKHSNFDWLAFTFGLICGVILYALLDLIIACRLAVSAWVINRGGGGSQRKPLYKLN